MAKKLLSIAKISRELNIPESTLHYWKNRFSEFLPSIGKGRQKRFRPEAVDVFRTISEMLSLGHTTKDVKSELASMYPINIDPNKDARSLPVPQQLPAQRASGEMQAEMARAVGVEIAKVVGEKLGEALELACGPGLADLSGKVAQTAQNVSDQAERLDYLQNRNEELEQTVEELRERLEQAPAAGGEASEGLDSVRQENENLKEKLSTLEAELVRLRKDRREMEKFLLGKIKSSS